MAFFQESRSIFSQVEIFAKGGVGEGIETGINIKN